MDGVLLECPAALERSSLAVYVCRLPTVQILVSCALISCTRADPPKTPLEARSEPSLPSSSLVRIGDSKQRPPVDPVSFRLDAIPFLDLPEPLVSSDYPKDLPVPTISLELSSGRIERTGIHRHVWLDGGFGHLSIGHSEGSLQDGITLPCDQIHGDPPRIAAMTLAQLAPPLAPHGRARFTRIDGWFDEHDCKTAAMTEREVELAPLGSIFAFRQHTGERDILTLVLPRADSIAVEGGRVDRRGDFAFVDMAPGFGARAAMVARFDSQSFAWYRRAAGDKDSVGARHIGVEGPLEDGVTWLYYETALISDAN